MFPPIANANAALNLGLLSVWTIGYAKSWDVHGQNLIETRLSESIEPWNMFLNTRNEF